MTTDNIPAGPVRVFVVDDHAVVRKGTRDMLDSHPDITVVGESESGEGLLDNLLATAPELVLLDINLPGKNGVELLSYIKAAFPVFKVILFSAHTDAQYIRRAQQLQADGYLSKTVGQQELVSAILSVCRRDANLPPSPVYSADVTQKAEEYASHAASAPKLTPREMEILLLVSKGMTNQAIAKDLFLSVKTVDTHVANLMKKLDMNKRTQLMAYAYEQGLIINL